ncbi:MAG TPA: hypothetical protein VHE53_03020 [Patescibacteria group bacterium]|nr:hypothetical protein [Patescibacteria group bacterium]
MNKVLVGISVLLLALILFEVGYLLLGSSPTSKSSVGVLSANLVRINSNALLNLVKIGTQGTLVYANADLGYEGKVLEIYNNPGNINGTRYELGVKLQGQRGQNVLYFLPGDISHIKVYSKIFGINLPTSFQSLRIGDNISVEVVKNLTKPFEAGQNTEKIEIIRQ